MNSSATACGSPTWPRPKARPCVYSAATLRDRYQAIDEAFGAYPHALHYALKANSTFAIARLVRELGGAADANSIWEIELARKAGFQPAAIVFTGVGKSADELECAVSLGLKAINVESAGELARVEAIAERTGVVARVAVRINPDIDSGSHPHISTGLKINKFGVPLDDARELLVDDRPAPRAQAGRGSRPRRLPDFDPRAAAPRGRRSSRACPRSCAPSGVMLEYADLGGGLGISYDGREVPSPAAYVAALVAEMRPTGLPIVIEPGRAIAGPAAVLVARVIDIKPRDASSDFVVIDAGMTELMRPALYGAFHRIEPLAPRDARRATTRSSARSARAATSSAATAGCRRSRSAISSPSATPARTDRRWRRTTIGGRCRRKSSWTTGRGASSDGGRRSRICSRRRAETGQT